jgi:hypothetical protein
MDIIAAHQQGLIEQMDGEAAALAGRRRDHSQRAVVLHHLYDHSGGGHAWALAEARRAMQILSGLAVLQRRLGHWGWRQASRDQACEALGCLAEALGEAGRARTAAAYRAYRLSTTKALRAEAGRSLPPALLAVLNQCQAARREKVDFAPEARLVLFEESERLAAAAVDRVMVDAAWAAIDQTGLRRAARRLLSDQALVRASARDKRRGWPKVERELRNDPVLPASFRANPAQHFYALQHMLQERRRQQWREACDREPDAFELAA